MLKSFKFFQRLVIVLCIGLVFVSFNGIVFAEKGRENRIISYQIEDSIIEYAESKINIHLYSVKQNPEAYKLTANAVREGYLGAPFTAFNVITGVYSPTKGNVVYNGENITSLTPDKITKKGIARTFQNIRLFKNLTVLDNILIANHLRLKSNFLSCTLRLPWSYKEEMQMRKKSEMLLDKLGLLALKNEIAHSLPYGEQRKLEIARALASNPEILLLDEPVAGMNEQESLSVAELLQKLQKTGLTILLIEHHMRFVMSVCDGLTVLNSGAVIAKGTPEEIQNNDEVIAVYLGKRHKKC